MDRECIKFTNTRGLCKRIIGCLGNFVVEKRNAGFRNLIVSVYRLNQGLHK
jgi:hypothetical protein